MDKTELEYKKQLAQAMDKAEQAQLVETLIAEWLEDYQELIIGNLKTCPVKEVMDLRNKLVASEDFRDWLVAKVNNGKIAKSELEELEQKQVSYTNSEDWYSRL